MIQLGLGDQVQIFIPGGQVQIFILGSQVQIFILGDQVRISEDQVLDVHLIVLRVEGLYGFSCSIEESVLKRVSQQEAIREKRKDLTETQESIGARDGVKWD
jgi:hypothetical protein